MKIIDQNNLDKSVRVIRNPKKNKTPIFITTKMRRS